MRLVEGGRALEGAEEKGRKFYKERPHFPLKGPPKCWVDDNNIPFSFNWQFKLLTWVHNCRTKQNSIACDEAYFSSHDCSPSTIEDRLFMGFVKIHDPYCGLG
jgi:hypothetical protein